MTLLQNLRFFWVTRKYPRNAAHERLLKYKWIRSLRSQLHREMIAHWNAEDKAWEMERRMVDLERELVELRQEVLGIDCSRVAGEPTAMQRELARLYLRQASRAFSDNGDMCWIEWGGHVAVMHLARFLARHQKPKQDNPPSTN